MNSITSEKKVMSEKMTKIGNQGEGGGRPKVVFTQDEIIQVEALAAVLTKKQVADYFSISENTLRAVEERQPELAKAYKRGRAKQIESMASNLVELAKAGNVTANIFYLKTQAGWNDTVDIAVNTERVQQQPVYVIVDK